MTEENNEYFARFKDTEWCIQDLPVLVVGLGGVGSWLSLFLVKQGYKVQGWDFDNVDVYNVSTQFYSSSDVDNTKSDSLKTNIETVSGSWSENQFIPYYDKFESNIEKVYPITVSCVDSFKGRKSIFDCWLKYYNMMKEDSFEFESRKNIYDYKIDDFLFIDTRMSAEKLWIYAVDPRKPEQIKKYLETIPTDEDAFGEKSYAELEKILNDWLNGDEADKSDGTVKGGGATATAALDEEEIVVKPKPTVTPKAPAADAKSSKYANLDDAFADLE